MELDDLLRRAVEAGASDIHLKFGRPPMLRRDGAVTPLAGVDVLSNAQLDGVLRSLTALTPSKYEKFNASGDLYFDVEADPLVADEGITYLFGLVSHGGAAWRAREKRRGVTRRK